MARQADSRAVLAAFIEQESMDLFVILRSYVTRMGLAPHYTVEQITQELMNQVVVEALQSADHFDPSRRPMPWLLGIGINLIRVQLRSPAYNREIPARDLFPTTQADLSDDELFECFGALVEASPAGEVEQDSWIADLLVQLPTDDRDIVRLAILNDLDSTALACELGITPGAARVRLHRAVKRLRSWFATQEMEQ
jgi:RNA polymerase sigma-70 factor (ECF subfamily)